MARYDDDLVEVGPIGSMYDLNEDDGPAPRLWGLKSVSKAAARALDRRPGDGGRVGRPEGFVHGRVR